MALNRSIPARNLPFLLPSGNVHPTWYEFIYRLASGSLDTTLTGLLASDDSSIVGREITAGSSKVSVTNGDGATGNPSIDIVQANLDHGAIGGLADDDHTQYHNDSRASTWLSTKSTSDLAEGSNLYYTDERVDDRAATLIQNGTGITWSYNDAGGTLTPSVTITQYTDEQVDDRVASLIQNGTGITWSYNDGANTLTPTVTASGSGDWAKISEQTASSSAQIDFTGLSSTYRAYRVMISNVRPATDATFLQMRVGTGGTPTYDTGSNYNSEYIGWSSSAVAENGQSAASTFMKMHEGITDQGNGANETACWEVVLYNPSNSTQYKILQTKGSIVSSTPTYISITGTGRYITTTAVTALRFYYGSGNIAEGIFTLYGMMA